MSKRAARRGARTHSLKIRSLARYHCASRAGYTKSEKNQYIILRYHCASRAGLCLGRMWVGIRRGVIIILGKTTTVFTAKALYPQVCLALCYQKNTSQTTDSIFLLTTLQFILLRTSKRFSLWCQAFNVRLLQDDWPCLPQPFSHPPAAPY